MNVEHARFNMIEQQIRPWEVVDAEALRLLMTLPREDYVPPPMRALAFADVEIPLPCGQVMLKPLIEGRILQALGNIRVDSALEIGPGSADFAALLAAHAKHVYTVEIEPELVQLACNNLARNNVTNVTVEEGDGAHGWFPQAPYDLIVVSGGLPELSAELLAQIKPGGRLFAFIGEAPVMKARIVTRLDEKQHRSIDLFETVVPMLRSVSDTNTFRF
jgi:protein-L-isoaspartate(D-aspartate) O-methyltransferase